MCRNAFEVYGSAATGFLATHPIDFVAESVGRLVSDADIEVVDRDGHRLPVGQTGHIRCRGAGISQGFYGPAAEPSVGREGFDAGWYYPGDIGSLSADGFLCLKGRAGDVIVRRGIEIYPTDIEEIYLAHPAIAEAAAVAACGTSGESDPGIENRLRRRARRAGSSGTDPALPAPDPARAVPGSVLSAGAIAKDRQRQDRPGTTLP